MAHTVTITTSDPATIQDVENYVTSLYQRGMDVSHITQMDEVQEVKEVSAEVEFPDESSSKTTRSRSHGS